MSVFASDGTLAVSGLPVVLSGSGVVVASSDVMPNGQLGLISAILSSTSV
jgi:hypothetical protein